LYDRAFTQFLIAPASRLGVQVPVYTLIIFMGYQLTQSEEERRFLYL
jgi:hypothetical protein